MPLLSATFVLFFIVCLFCALLSLTYQGTTNNQGMLVMLTDLQTTLANSTINLNTSSTPFNSQTQSGTLTPPTYTGYAAQTVTTWPNPVNDPVYGGFSLVGPQNTFTCTSAPATPVTIYGWYLLDAASNIIAGGNFQTPVIIQHANDAVPLQILLNAQGPGQVQVFANVS